MSSRRLVVVCEQDEPVLLNSPLIEPLPLRDRLDWIEIVSHDPSWIQMCLGRNQVGDVAGMLGSAAGGLGLDVDSHHLRRMPRKNLYADSGTYFRIGLDSCAVQ